MPDVEVFRPYLAPGETVRWTGRPQRGVVFRTLDLFLVPFSLVWAGGVGMAMFGAVQNGVTMSAVVAGLMTAIGAYLVFGRFAYDALLRSRMRYALTDRRALMLGGLSGKELSEVDLRMAPVIHYRQTGGGRGSISFNHPTGLELFGNVWQAHSKVRPELFRIDRAEEAYRLIQSARTRGG